jgi:sterol desaturase/sphingolipid hydroxylase (fatty acid hydroxylase superfamily)
MENQKAGLKLDVIEQTGFSRWKYLYIASFTAFTFLIYAYVKFFFTYYVKEETGLIRLYFKYISPTLAPLIILSNLYWAFLYYFRFPFIEKFKVNNVPWPWEEDPKGWWSRFASCFKVYFINQALIFPVVFFVVTMFFKCDVSVANLPSYFTFLWQLILSVIIEDFFFYFSHRALHTPYLYVRIHKKHHEFYNTISFASVYAHWLEFIIGNAMPMLGSLILLQKHLHIITYTGYAYFRIAGTYAGHSGYEFPWHPFKFFAFNAETGFHNYHHLKNIGNYGSSLWIWDYYFGTSEHFYQETGFKK